MSTVSCVLSLFMLLECILVQYLGKQKRGFRNLYEFSKQSLLIIENIQMNLKRWQKYMYIQYSLVRIFWETAPSRVWICA